MMVRDPIQWETDYKEGSQFRQAYLNTGENYTGHASKYYCTHIWLMGDGTSDSPSTTRNYVNTADTSYTHLIANNMVSADLETVTIPGLT